MARGIEHREAEDVIKAYELGNKPNWGIFAGSELMVAYDGGTIEDGINMLRQYLEVLEQGGSKTVFTLKTYYADTTKITNKTPNSGSTTFMLCPGAATAIDDKTGLVILDKTNYSRPQPSQQTDPALLARLEKLEKQNEILNNQLIDAKFKALEDRYSTAISGLTNQSSPWEKLIDNIAENPKIIPESIGALGDVFMGIYSRIKGETPPPVYRHTMPIAGTEEPKENINEPKKQEPQMSTQNTQLETETLTEDQINAYHDDQEQFCDNLEERLGIANYTGYLKYLDSLTDEQLTAWSLQEQQLQIIRSRLYDDQLTNLVTEVAKMNDLKLKLLLGYLD